MVNEYSDVIDFLNRVESPKEKKMNARKKFAKEQVVELRKKHPGVPEDFLSYLEEVGSGAFRECQFAVLGHLSSLDENLGAGVLILKESDVRCLCFGDNFSGDFTCFLPEEGWKIAEVWHTDGTLNRFDSSFSEYIREQMLMGPKGEDLRLKTRKSRR